MIVAEKNGDITVKSNFFVKFNTMGRWGSGSRARERAYKQKKKYPTAHYGDNNALKRAEKSKTFSRVVGKITFLMNLMKTKRSPQDS